jgi:hypothetical protein
MRVLLGSLTAFTLTLSACAVKATADHEPELPFAFCHIDGSRRVIITPDVPNKAQLCLVVREDVLACVTVGGLKGWILAQRAAD